MIDYHFWRDMVVAYVRLRASRAGWVVVRVRQSRSSRSWYVELDRRGVLAVVRVSDHRPFPSNRRRRYTFSVRQAATLQLDMFDGWLHRRFEAVRSTWST